MNDNDNENENARPVQALRGVDALVPYLVNGPRLGEAAARKLRGAFGGLAELCRAVHSQQGVDGLVELLGREDAVRVVDFLTTERAVG